MGKQWEGFLYEPKLVDTRMDKRVGKPQDIDGRVQKRLNYIAYTKSLF